MKKWLSKIIPLGYGQLLNLMALFSPKAAAKKGFDIFCTIRKGRVLPQQASFLNEAKHKLENTAGHQVQSYFWKGKKETVLLMHGWESNAFRWRKLIKKLQEKGYNVLAFDAPGHGNSSGKRLHVALYAEATRHFLNTYRPNYVVGHSIGGMAILYEHHKNSKSSVEKIITVGSPCEFEKFMVHYQGLLKFNNTVRKAMDNALKERFGYHFHEFTSARFVSNNTIKGLLLHDEEDQQVSVEASKKVHRHWKSSELITTRGFGHSMHQDEVNTKIIDFLAS